MTPIPALASTWPEGHASLVCVARERARATPAQPAFVFLDHAAEASGETALSCVELDRRARQIAALLQSKGRAGCRVLLCYPAGLDFLSAFFGTLYAGMVAVPAYPPLNPRLAARLRAVARDCDATLALTTHATVAELQSLAPESLGGLPLLATDTRLDGLEHAWRETKLAHASLAFLQYTSGSSGVPKGVMVTHGNLLHNVCAITQQMSLGAPDHIFSWLPPYHDMGLIGSILTPFSAGLPMTFMTPHAFLRRPARWLREISARGCTVSGAPNFAYELCLAKVGEQELDGLDLSSWSLAFSGAEPVKRDTMERFAARFERCGFDAKAFYPCYGMAETTLIVTGKRRDLSYRFVEHADAPVASQTSERQRRAVVSCGETAPGFEVAVVDPVSLEPRASGQMGEILVRGPSVAAGYWNRELETLATFAARIPGRDAPFLRTGDLGFVDQGELFVNGRSKDVIIVRGVNHYPQDIETTVDACHEAIRTGCGICFSVEHAGEERLVVVQELGRRDVPRAAEIMLAIRMAILAAHDLAPHVVVLIENGRIHKTTSGKLARRPCRQDFLDATLPVLARWDALAAAPAVSACVAAPAN